MPNECMNEMIICGDENKIKQIIEIIKKDGMNQGFVPINKDSNCMDRSSAWGTKWEVCWDNIEIESYSGYQLKMKYATAWGPNTNVANAIYEFGEDDLDVELLYWEPNCDFCGRYRNGYEEDGEINVSNWNGFFGEIPRWKYIEIGIKNGMCTAKNNLGEDEMIGLKLEDNGMFSYQAEVIEIENHNNKWYLSMDQCYELGLMGA